MRALLLIPLLAFPASADGQTSYETPPVLRSMDLAPEALLEGPHHRLDEQVPTDGFLATFQVRSDFGDFEVRSLELLATRVHELSAIAELQEIENNEEFVDGLRDSVDETSEALRHAANAPVGTAKAIPKGAKRFFDRTLRAGKTAIQTLEERRAEARESGTQDEDLAGDVARSTGRATADIFGYDDARRSLAKRLEVDPYTTNPLLSQKLDEVARAGFAGRLGVRVAKAAIPGTTLLSVTQTASEWVYDTSPGDIDVEVERRLRAMAVEQDAIDQLLRHEAYSVTLYSAFVAALGEIEGVENRLALVPWALSAETEDDARLVVRSALMLVEYHQHVSPVASLVSAEPVVGRTEAGALAAVAPLDYVVWTEAFALFAARPELAGPQRALLLSGRASPRARRELESLGWQLHESVLTAQPE